MDYGAILQTVMHTGLRHARLSIRAAASWHGIGCSAGMFHGGDDREDNELISNKMASRLPQPTPISNSLGTWTLDDSVVKQ